MKWLVNGGVFSRIVDNCKKKGYWMVLFDSLCFKVVEEFQGGRRENCLKGVKKIEGIDFKFSQGGGRGVGFLVLGMDCELDRRGF